MKMPVLNPDAALPASISGSGHSWFTRYRRYPVFSGPWVRGRMAVFATLATLGLVAVSLPMVFSASEPLPLGGLMQLTVQLFLPLLLGPWLGWQVRRHGWPPAREGAGLAGAVLATVLVMLALHQWAAEPGKQWLAERTGMVDETGKRKKVVMAIGVIVSTPPDAAASAPARAPEPPTPNLIANAISSALISFCLAGGAALWGWRREREGLAALAREHQLVQALAQRREAELRLSVLAAQVEPHFLFNTLAGVRSAIATDPARASEMIDQLVDYLRAAIPRLRSDGSAQATVGAQFELVRAYLGLMAARMPRLQVKVHAPGDLLLARCPPLMLISLAENAVKHGVELKMGAAQVEVRAERCADGRLTLTVLDDGMGFKHGSGESQLGSGNQNGSGSGIGMGLGLTNVRERLAQLYGTRAALSLKARPEGGVAAILTLPLEMAD